MQSLTFYFLYSANNANKQGPIIKQGVSRTKFVNFQIIKFFLSTVFFVKTNFLFKRNLAHNYVYVTYHSLLAIQKGIIQFIYPENKTHF